MRPPGEGFELGVRFPPPEGRLISKRAGVVALFLGRKARTYKRGPMGPRPTHVCLVRETRLLPPKAGRLASRSAKPTLDGSSLNSHGTGGTRRGDTQSLRSANIGRLDQHKHNSQHPIHQNKTHKTLAERKVKEKARDTPDTRTTTGTSRCRRLSFLCAVADLVSN